MKQIKRLVDTWFSQDSTDMIWLLLGLVYSLGFIAALFQLNGIFILCNLAIAFLLLSFYTKYDLRLVLITCVMLYANFRYGQKTLQWDVVSFELQNYFDWVHNIRGAYWDYGKLPSAYYGAMSQYGEKYYSLVFAVSCVAFCAAIFTLSKATLTKNSIIFYAVFAYVMVLILGSAFHVGKGDMINSTFCIVVLSYSIRILENVKHENLGINTAIVLIYSALAINAKTGAVIFIIPMLIYLLFKLRFRLYDLKEWIIPAVLLGGICCYPIAYNYFKYGAIIDTNQQQGAFALSLINNLPDFLNSIVAYPLNRGPIALALIVSLSAFNIFRKRPRPEMVIIYFILLITLLFMPYVYFHGASQLENYRLILFPLISMLVLFYDKEKLGK